jgi:hypothetical protein
MMSPEDTEVLSVWVANCNISRTRGLEKASDHIFIRSSAGRY